MSPITLEGAARYAVQQHERLLETERQILELHREVDAAATRGDLKAAQSRMVRDLAAKRRAAVHYRRLVDAALEELGEVVGFDRASHQHPQDTGIAIETDNESISEEEVANGDREGDGAP